MCEIIECNKKQFDLIKSEKMTSRSCIIDLWLDPEGSVSSFLEFDYLSSFRNFNLIKLDLCIAEIGSFRQGVTASLLPGLALTNG